MTYNQLEERLEKGSLSSCYLFVGEEEFLKQQAVKRLSSLLSARKTVINAENEKELNNILSQSNLFGRRLILIEGASSFSKENKGFLLEYIKNPESSTLIFLEKERNPNLEKKIVGQEGEVVFFPHLKGTSLILWAKGLFNKEGKEIEKEALDTLLNMVGEAPALLAVEIEKLILFCQEKERVTSDDVAISSSGLSQEDSFRLFELIKRGDEKAITLCLQLLEIGGMSESHILFFLASRIRKERRYKEDPQVFNLLAEADLSLKREPKVSYRPIILSLLLRLMVSVQPSAISGQQRP